VRQDRRRACRSHRRARRGAESLDWLEPLAARRPRLFGRVNESIQVLEFLGGLIPWRS
jgi:hypothetical protein